MLENTNRAFMYGESVFTTMRMVDGQLRDWNQHFIRLKKGVEFVYGPFTDQDGWEVSFKNRLESLIADETGDKIIRLTVYRDQTRASLKPLFISSLDLKIHYRARAHDPSDHGKMYKLRTCPAVERPSWWPSYLKAGNYLETILAQKFYLKDDDDDLLFISAKNTVLESSIANIFVVRHNRIYTAPLGPQVLDGVIRRKVLESASHYFSEIIESETTVDQLLRADAVFGSNSVKGLFLVDRINEYAITYNEEFFEKFRLLKNKVFE